jgi:hypothetical protein
MIESAESPAPLFAQKWAVRFGAALLAGLALVVALATFDRVQRARLESTAETTAVGDVKYFKLPAKLPAVVTSFKATDIVVLAVDEIGVRDTHVRRLDAPSGFTIYELSAAATDEERARVAASGATYLLKLAPNEYAGAAGR